MSTPTAAPVAPAVVVSVLDAVAPKVAKLAQKVPSKIRLIVNTLLIAFQAILPTVILPSGTPSWIDPTIAAVLLVAQAAFIAGNTPKP